MEYSDRVCIVLTDSHLFGGLSGESYPRYVQATNALSLPRSPNPGSSSPVSPSSCSTPLLLGLMSELFGTLSYDPRSTHVSVAFSSLLPPTHVVDSLLESLRVLQQRPEPQYLHLHSSAGVAPGGDSVSPPPLPVTFKFGCSLALFSSPSPPCPSAADGCLGKTSFTVTGVVVDVGLHETHVVAAVDGRTIETSYTSRAGGIMGYNDVVDERRRRQRGGTGDNSIDDDDDDDDEGAGGRRPPLVAAFFDKRDKDKSLTDAVRRCVAGVALDDRKRVRGNVVVVGLGADRLPMIKVRLAEELGAEGFFVRGTKDDDVSKGGSLDSLWVGLSVCSVLEMQVFGNHS